MKNKNWILFFACISFALGATAQTPTTPPVCYSRCNLVPVTHPDGMDPRFFESVRKIQAKKKEEIDPVKIKELEEAEKDEMERIMEKHRKFCSKLCKYDD
ncbi:MAG: hypothetical protein V4488_22805 [Pseudomonadota bacterium]